MRRQLLSLVVLVSGACGGSSSTPGGDDEPPADGQVVPTMITVTGTAVEVEASGSTPLEGVLVEAFLNSDESTPVISAMTDANGNYTLTAETNGSAFAGYLKATLSGLRDTYLYPPGPIAEDFDGASINMIANNTFGLLNTVCGGNQMMSMGTIAMLVQDAAGMPVMGAVVSSTPAATSDCYNTDQFPSGDAQGTFNDGIGYLFNVLGTATVSATADGLTIPSHEINVRAGVLTTTLIKAQ